MITGSFQITKGDMAMKRVFFRNSIVGILLELALDAIWIVIDGKMFPGGIILNKVTNALCFSVGVAVGCVWYLYVMESLGIRITKKLTALVMFPAAVSLAIGFSSIWTGWRPTTAPPAR